MHWYWNTKFNSVATMTGDTCLCDSGYKVSCPWRKTRHKTTPSNTARVRLTELWWIQPDPLARRTSHDEGVALPAPISLSFSNKTALQPKDAINYNLLENISGSEATEQQLLLNKFLKKCKRHSLKEKKMNDLHMNALSISTLWFLRNKKKY